MNNKKKTVLAAAFVVAIMAAAGIGYAVTHPNYEGKTDSGTNTYDVDYVVVKLRPDDYTGKDFSTAAANALYITYDTVTDYDTDHYVTTYTWKDSTVVTHEVTIEVPTSNGSNVDPDTLTLTAKVNGTITTGYKLQYSSNGTTWEDYDTTDGVVIDNPTTGSAITFNWRAAPDQDDITPGDDLTISMPSATSVVLPAITYTVEATQISA